MACGNDNHALRVCRCSECLAKPKTFADGTQPGKERVTDVRELHVATARAEAAIEVLRVLLDAWRKEMRSAYTTPEQQAALRRAEEMCR